MCAKALLDKGRSVTMIDVGRTCEPEKYSAAKDLARESPERWRAELVDQVKGNVQVDFSGLPQKRVFGSDFAYAMDELGTIEQRRTKCTMSFARGGLTNVWGAAMLPNHASEFETWPIDPEDIAPSYRAVAKLVGISGVKDDLEPLFPYYEPPNQPLKLSRQAHYLLDRWRPNQVRLAKQGFTFGQSRLAVKAGEKGERTCCQNCGLCLTGCPYEAIYNSSQTLALLIKHPRFQYIDRIMVRACEESPAGRVSIYGESSGTGKRIQFEGNRLFLACGVLSTVKIVLNSLSAFADHLEILYQPYFLLPLLMRKNFRQIKEERLHSLAQIFIELTDPDISAETVHLQLYTYNNMMEAKLLQIAKDVRPIRWLLEQQLLGRLLALQGYFAAGPENRIQVVPIQTGGGLRLEPRADSGHDIGRSARKVAWKLMLNSFPLGVVSLVSMVHVGSAGDGNHLGGVFPMRKDPTGLESDAYGRIGPFTRIHIVDGSVLTSIPSSTITYTIMANAHRIGTAVSDLN